MILGRGEGVSGNADLRSEDINETRPWIGTRLLDFQPLKFGKRDSQGYHFCQIRCFLCGKAVDIRSNR
jgi:hypothetical protein